MPEVLASEIMAAAGARELRDGEVVVVGLGLPQVACVLAKRTHAPGLSALLEIGVMNMQSDRYRSGFGRCAYLVSGNMLERLSGCHGNECASRCGRRGFPGSARNRSFRQHQYNAVEGRLRKSPATSTAARAETILRRWPSGSS